MTVTELLEKTERSRRSVSERLSKTPEALRGIDDLLAYLTSTAYAIQRNAPLQRLQFFVTRCAEDIEVGVVATFMGMIAVSVDACRDLMEMELLLKDFALAPQRMDEWFNADERTRMNSFRSVQLRQRQARQQGIDPKDLPDSDDYAKHSASLHVTPTRMLWRRGIVDDPFPWFESDFAIAEILDHAERFLQALFWLAESIAPGVLQPVDRATDFSLAVTLVRTEFVPRFRDIVDNLPDDTA